MGLDKLAAAKKKEKLEISQNKTPVDTSEPGQPTSKRSKTYSYTTGEEEVLDANTPSHHSSSSHHRRGDSRDDNDMKEKNRKYRDRDYVDDNGKKTPTPHRSYHDKISRDGGHRHGEKGVYASTNKCNCAIIT